MKVGFSFEESICSHWIGSVRRERTVFDLALAVTVTLVFSPIAWLLVGFEFHGFIRCRFGLTSTRRRRRKKKLSTIFSF